MPLKLEVHKRYWTTPLVVSPFATSHSKGWEEERHWEHGWVRETNATEHI